MIILGIDPGTIVTGYGIIKQHRQNLSLVVQGTIKLPAAKNLPQKLEIIYNEIDRLIKLYSPEEFALESAFYGKNVQSAMKIGYARGVSMLAAVHNGLPVSEYAPREIKKAVVGNGAASKTQVQYMVNSLLGIKNNNGLFDETDALAVAICHSFRIKAPFPSKKSWKAFVEANPGRIIQ